MKYVDLERIFKQHYLKTSLTMLFESYIFEPSLHIFHVDINKILLQLSYVKNSAKSKEVIVEKLRTHVWIDAPRKKSFFRTHNCV